MDKRLAPFLLGLALAGCQFTGEVTDFDTGDSRVFDTTWVTYSDDLANHEYDRLATLVPASTPGDREIVIRDPGTSEVGRHVTRWPYNRIERARQHGYVWANQGGIIRRLLVWFDGYFGQYTDHEFVVPNSHRFSDGVRSGSSIGVTDLAVDRISGTLYVLAHYWARGRQRAAVLAFSDADDSGTVRHAGDTDADGESLEHANRITVDSLTRNVYVSRDQTVTVFDRNLTPRFTGPAVSGSQLIDDMEAGAHGLVLSTSDTSGSYLHLFRGGVPEESWASLAVETRDLSTVPRRRYALAVRNLPPGTRAGCDEFTAELWAVVGEEMQRHYICR